MIVMIKNCFFKPFNGQILMTNYTDRYAFLTKENFDKYINGTLSANSEEWQMLSERYFISDKSEEVYIREAEFAVKNSKAYLFSPTSLFIFAVTNLCNAGCVYCQARGISNKKQMNIEVAKKAIERISESPAMSFTIEFQGGEPLLNFDTIKYIVHYSKEIMPERKINFVIVSNLSMMTEEIADFFKENKISVSTSLDGPKWLHDKNRPLLDGGGTYDEMLKGKEILLSRGISAGAIQTTTRWSLPYFKEIINEYVVQGYHSLFLRPLTKLGSALNLWNEIGYTPEEYLNFYRGALNEIIRLNISGINISERFASIFLRKIFGYPAPNYMELRSPCGASVGQVAITATGDVYTCDEGRMIAEMGDNTFRLGNVFKDSYSDWISSTVCKAVMSASLLETLPSCSECVYRPYCGVCPVVNYMTEGDLRSREPNGDRCRIYKGILDFIMELLMKNDPVITNLFEKWAMKL